jgi:hypothetical protein
MKPLLLSLLSASLLMATLPSQDAVQEPAVDPKAAVKKRLKAALAKSGATADTAFSLKWGPDKKAKQNNPFAAMMGQSNSGSVKGSWHDDCRTVKFAGKGKDELLLSGTRMLARDDNRDWCRRNAHFADGNQITYIPDPQVLLQQLAAWPLAITHREAGALNDRPVEIVSVTLNADQVGELFWSGALPESMGTNNGNGNVFRIARQVGGGRAARAAATPPDVTMDLAISLDPSTHLVHEIRARAWAKENANMAVFVINGRIGGNADDEEEDEDEVDESAPLVYEKGLPKRPRKKMSVANFTLRLTEHGQRAKAELNDKQRSLLR